MSPEPSQMLMDIFSLYPQPPDDNENDSSFMHFTDILCDFIQFVAARGRLNGEIDYAIQVKILGNLCNPVWSPHMFKNRLDCSQQGGNLNRGEISQANSANRIDEAQCNPILRPRMFEGTLDCSLNVED